MIICITNGHLGLLILSELSTQVVKTTVQTVMGSNICLLSVLKVAVLTVTAGNTCLLSLLNAAALTVTTPCIKLLPSLELVTRNYVRHLSLSVKTVFKGFCVFINSAISVPLSLFPVFPLMRMFIYTLIDGIKSHRNK